MTRPARRAVLSALALLTVTAVTAAVPQPARAVAARPAAATRHCTAPAAAAAQAARLERAVTPLVAAAAARTSLSVRDLTSGTTCTWNPAARFDSASIVKASITATLLWRNHLARRPLSAAEVRWTTASIEHSDNAATTALWNHIGAGAGLGAFLRAAGMTRTTPGPGGYWGLTQVAAADQVRLLILLAGAGPRFGLPAGDLLGPAARGYELGLMRHVEADQRWGAPAGAPAGSLVAVKNGWLPRATAGWRVNSLAYVVPPAPLHPYVLAVLSDHNPTMAAGIAADQRLARAAAGALRG